MYTEETLINVLAHKFAHILYGNIQPTRFYMESENSPILTVDWRSLIRKMFVKFIVLEPFTNSCFSRNI